MQVIANQSGASQKRLRCHFSAVTEQKVTLKDQFLKHSDEYVLTVENCYTNASPNLFFRDEVAIRIMPKAPQNTAFPLQYPANHPLQLYSSFSIGPTRKDGSVIAFIDRLREFIEIFNFKLYIYGSAQIVQHNDAIPAIQNPNQNHDLYSYTDVDIVDQYIQVGLSPNGELQIKCNDDFLNNFYIEFSERFAKLAGFDRYLWVRDTGLASNAQNHMTIVNQAGNFAFPLGDVNQAGNMPTYGWIATKSVFQIDQRISIDVESTVPVFNTMTSEFSKEKQEHLLSRFVIPDYKEVKSHMTSEDGLLVTGITFEDEGESVHNLVRNPYCKVNAMRSGQIQAVNISMWVRYLVDNTLEKIRFVLEENEWVDMGLLFSKKI